MSDSDTWLVPQSRVFVFCFVTLTFSDKTIISVSVLPCVGKNLFQISLSLIRTENRMANHHVYFQRKRVNEQRTSQSTLLNEDLIIFYVCQILKILGSDHDNDKPSKFHNTG
jgi:hypothetical protein